MSRPLQRRSWAPLWPSRWAMCRRYSSAAGCASPAQCSSCCWALALWWSFQRPERPSSRPQLNPAPRGSACKLVMKDERRRTNDEGRLGGVRPSSSIYKAPYYLTWDLKAETAALASSREEEGGGWGPTSRRTAMEMTPQSSNCSTYHGRAVPYICSAAC